MGTVTVRELSHDTSGTLRRVKAGETVEITERGKVIGRIVPADSGEDLYARLVAEGRLKPSTGSREALLAQLKRRLATEPIDYTNAGTNDLLAMREEER